MIRKTLPILVLLLLSAPKAEGALLLAIEVNGVQACASDNNVGCAFGTPLQDIDPTIGVLSFGNQPIQVGILEISGSVQQATVGGTQNILNASSTQITNTSTTQNAVGNFTVSSTDFTPISLEAFASGSATWQNASGSSINMGWWDDPLNAQGAETATDRPGDLIFACNDVAVGIADATSCAGSSVVNDQNAFSMTLGTDFLLVAGGTVVNRGQTLIKPVEQNVPEPFSIVLMGLGLLGVISRRSR